MKYVKAWMGFAVLAMMTVGCVSQRELDEMRTLYRQSQDQILELQAQLEEARARIAALQAAGGDEATLRQQLADAIAERDRLQKLLAEAEQRLREGAVGVALPADLDTALRELAQQYPDLLTYDPDRGMVKFRSDFTFDLGSAELKPQATEMLNRLAQILKSGSASGYEIRIVGHTDNVPIGNPATRAKHPTNWHLSVHRAISVENALERAGIPPVRMGVAGYSQYRPVVPNSPRGAEANRRVELYLVPMSPSQLQEAPAAAPAPEKGVRQAAPAAPAQAPAAPAESPALYK